MQSTLDTKVTMEQFNEVRELMLKLPSYEDVEALKLYVTENIEKFRDDNDYFTDEFEK